MPLVRHLPMAGLAPRLSDTFSLHCSWSRHICGRFGTCSIILYIIFVRHKTSQKPAAPLRRCMPQWKKKWRSLFFFVFSFLLVFGKCSHFLVFSFRCEGSCRLQIESSMRLSLPGHKFGSALSFWSFALSHFYLVFFFLAAIFAVVLHCFGVVSHGPGHIKLIVFMA